MLTVITRQRAHLRSLSVIRRLAVKISNANIGWDFREFPCLILLEAALVLTGTSHSYFDELTVNLDLSFWLKHAACGRRERRECALLQTVVRDQRERLEL